MFKWIYQMGAAHENERIRRLIAEFTLAANHEAQIFDTRFSDKTTTANKDTQRMNELKAAKTILERLIRPEFIGEREYGSAPIDRQKS